MQVFYLGEATFSHSDITFRAQGVEWGANQKSKVEGLFPSIWKVKSESRSVMYDSLRPHGLYSPWNSPGQDTGVDSLSLLQEIFPAQGLNPGLLNCRQILYQPSHKGSPIHLERSPSNSRGNQRGPHGVLDKGSCYVRLTYIRSLLTYLPKTNP